MIMRRAERQALELLGALGRVEAPSAAVLAAARESLWSQVADEMLSADLTGDAAPHSRERPGSAQRPAPRRKPDQAPQLRRHRQAGG
jgi:hypothetical protein